MGKEAGSAFGYIGPGLGAIGGIYSAISGAKEKRDADRALANYKRQELKNVAENLAVSTRGAEVQTEKQAQLEANQVDALRGGGTRALIGGLGRVEAGSQAVAENIGINLDEQQKQIDQMYAQDEARIRAIQEGRENADIAALSSQSQAGKDAMYMGFGNIIQGAGELGTRARKNMDQKEYFKQHPLDMPEPPYSGKRTENNIRNEWFSYESRKKGSTYNQKGTTQSDRDKYIQQLNKSRGR